MIPSPLSYVGRRIASAVFVLWAAYTLTYIILYLVPGDPALLIAGGAGGVQASPKELSALRAELGLNQPFIVQYGRALLGAVTGHLGDSYQLRKPVADIISERIGSTCELALFALVVALIGGLIVGGLTAYTRSRALAQAIDAIPPIAASLPTFWIGLVLMQVISFRLGWLPSAGDVGFASLILPGITMAVPGIASVGQVFARSLRTEYRGEYLAVATSKGASRSRVFFAHAARNALLPVLTVSGMLVANLFAYSAISESIFSRAGLGLALDAAVQSKDIPVVQGIVLVIAGVFVVANLAVDLLYPLVDPRLRTERTTFGARLAQSGAATQ